MAAADIWDKTPDEQTFGRSGAPITPSDDEDLAIVSKGLFVAAAGNVKFVPVDNEYADTITVTAAPVGVTIPFFVKRVLATGTTATVCSVK